MPATLSPVTYGPTANGFSPPTGVKPLSCRYSVAIRSDQLSPIACGWLPDRPAFGPPAMRLEIAWPYSWPITDMSKSPSTHGA